jgi:PPOX class probable F420-dependent enzyme
MSAELDRLGAAQYLLLTTFRKDGRAVPTAVWAARDGAELVVWTVADSGKVKRVRRDGAVEVGPCDRGGQPLGESVRGHAVVLDAERTEAVRRTIAAKYGLVGRLVMAGSRLRRGSRGTVGLAITLPAE